MVVADALSRLSPQDKREIPGIQVKVHHLVEITPVKLNHIKEETAQDGTLQILTPTSHQGWPGSIKKIQTAIKPYLTNRDNISIQEGMVLLGSRIIIRESRRQMIMQEIHNGHLGMEECRSEVLYLLAWYLQRNRNYGCLL